MAAVTTALAATIAGLDAEEKRRAVLEQVHPRHAALSPSWAVLADAYEGDGGFLTGEYLERFPAEIQTDYDERKRQTRYHNFLESLIDIYVRHTCSQGVTRSSESADLQAWWANVDGRKTGIQDFIKQVAAHALNLGHCAVLVDKTPEAPVGPAKADERARVVASIFHAPSVLDWRLDVSRDLAAVKLLEAAPQGAITDTADEADSDKQYAIWTTAEFARFDAAGELIQDGQHQLGLVPLALLRPKPSTKYDVVGRPLVRADVITALLNRASEEDHVLRAQGFSLLTVSMPADAPDEAVEQTQENAAQNFGVKRVLVARGTTAYVSPDMAIPSAIRENITFLIRELYRAAHIPYVQDSRDAESAESRRLKNAELNEMLRSLAQSLSALELRLARFWFGWMSPTHEAAEAAFQAAKVSVQYPTEFFTHELVDEVKALVDAFKLGLGETFEKRQKKRIVRRIEPDLPEDVWVTVEQEIDAIPAGQAKADQEAQKLREQSKQRLEAFAQQVKPQPHAGGPNAPDAKQAVA